MRIDLTDFMSNLGGGHVIKCLAGSLFRWINWVCLLVVAFLACELLVGLSFGSALVRMCSIIDQLQSWLHIFVGQHVNSIVPSLCLVGIGEAVTLWHVTSAASLSFKGTTALVATRLGANLPFQLAAHKLSNILSAFSPETGKPKSCVEMVSWPHAACFKRSVSRDLRIYLWEVGALSHFT